jgi:DNA-binding Lrp family transcriptional regulator
MDSISQFKKILKLDRINLEIFKNISKFGKINYSMIGKELGISHVSIKNRFEKLINSNVIKPTLLFNFSELDFKIAVLLLELETESLEKINEFYSSCPRVLYSFNTLGEYNHILVLFGETLEIIETMVNSCMLYNINKVRKSNILIFGKLLEDLFLPLDFTNFGQQDENTPCGNCCKSCKSYIQEQCIGCPGSKYYNGPLKIV